MTTPVRAEVARPAAGSRTAVLRLLGVVVLTVPAVLGFRAAFGTDRALVTAGAGLLLGVLVGWLSAARRLSAITTTAVLLVVGALAAGPAALPATTVAGVVPTASTFRELAGGVVRCWRDLLTATAPTGVLGDLLLVPYLTALLGGVLGAVLALRTRTPGWAVAPAGAVLLVSVLVGTRDAVSPLLQGGIFAVLAVVWLATTSTAWSRPGVVRAGSALALLVAAAAGAAVLGPAVTHLAGQRFVLRDRIEPPLDIRAYQSPLNGFRQFVKDERDTTLFTVTGAPKGSRIRLATMDAYDGTVWNVAGSTGAQTGSSGSFRRLPVQTGADPAAVTVHVSVAGFTGVWLPDLGDLRSVSFTGPRAAQLGDDFRYNTATGTGIVTDGLQKGDGYTISAVVPRQPSGQALAETRTAALIQPPPVDVPPVITSVAADTTDKATSAYARAHAIAEKLRTGYFSDGLANQAVSRAGHGAGRLADLLGAKIWVGDQEQYSAAAALMARQLGLPTRVVMGFDVPGAGSGAAAPIKGSDVTAWIEVAFQGVGWVPFDVTPDENRTPPEQVPQPAPKPKPATQQPPPPVEQPPPQQPATGSDQGKQDHSPSAVPAWLATVLTVAAWVLGPLLVIALVCAVIVGLKLRRRRRRRRLGPAERRVAAGWWEVLDAHRDHGAVLPRWATRREIAGALGRPGTRELADRADGAVFAGGVVTDDQATDFWSLVDRELGELRSGGFRARWRGRLSLRSLLRRTS